MKPPLVAFHGTSTAALERIRSQQEVKPVFTRSNVSLGGCYFTVSRAVAITHAQLAAACDGSAPVLISVRPSEDLLPDEDWVVRAFDDTPVEGDEICDPRLRAFFNDLFQGYIVDSSLSDHYKVRYDELNATYSITWEDSLRWIGSFRQRNGLSPLQSESAEIL